MPGTFDHLPDSSRIWIYQSDRLLTEKEAEDILSQANEFVDNWNSHGRDLIAGAEVLLNRFIVLSVNEDHKGASGCSIDHSVNFIRELEKTYQISLLDRSKIAFMEDQAVQITDLKELEKKIDAGMITADTLIFNNLVEKKGDLEKKWIIPAGSTWIKKYFNSN